MTEATLATMSDGEESPVPLSGGNSGSGGGSGERQWYAPMETSTAENDSQPASPGSPAPTSNIHTSNEYMELDEPEMLDEKKALLEEFERKRRARMIHVTTDDSEVRYSAILSLTLVEENILGYVNLISSGYH